MQAMNRSTVREFLAPGTRVAPGEVRDYGVPVVNRALDGVTGTTAVHVCFGYAAIIHGRPAVAPDCGNLPRAAAYGKLAAMTEAATRPRKEIGG
jgi:hypothetical protein